MWKSEYEPQPRVGDLVEVFRVKPLSEHDTLQEYETSSPEKRAAGCKRSKQEIVSFPLLGSSVFLILEWNFEILIGICIMIWHKPQMAIFPSFDSFSFKMYRGNIIAYLLWNSMP